MKDYFNIPTLDNRNQIFYANGSIWQIWNKPKNSKFVNFFVIGGGGGGGGGRTSALNSATGGGGGGSSSITTALYPANIIPDTLYIKVGLGGAGSTSAGTSGSNGDLSYISMIPDSSTNINIFMQSGSASATAGGGGGSSVVGSAGVGGTAWAYGTFVFGNLGLITTIAGQNGASGGSIAGSVANVTPILPISGGAGGGGVSSGGTTYNAGSILGSGFLPTISGGGNGVFVSGENGFTSINNIMTNFKIPMFFTGGAGGSSNNGGGGGNGGNASYGSGGGGGGGTYSGGTGGLGGKGGDGLVIVTCW